MILYNKTHKGNMCGQFAEMSWHPFKDSVKTNTLPQLMGSAV